MRTLSHKIILLITPVILLALALARVNAGDDEILSLVPWPFEIVRSTGEFHMSRSANIFSSADARNTAKLTAADIRERFGISIDVTVVPQYGGFIMAMANTGIPETPPPASPNGEESYKLIANPESTTIVSRNSRGLYWGTRTLLQLMRLKKDEIVIPGVEVTDMPRFPRRSLLVDPARNFISMSYLKRTVGIMADYKYNVLHLHLTDDQGWRFESRKHPRLHEVGGDGVYYTRRQLIDLVKYAAERGVEILPEIDMPGHATAMIYAYPELSCGGKVEKTERKVGILPYALCPAKEEVYDFVKDVLAETAETFPSDFIHVGSDEVLAYDWDSCPMCAQLKKTERLDGKHGLHAYFLKRVGKILDGLGKRMIVWDEATHLAPRGTVIQAWRKRQWAYESASAGKTTLCGPIGHTYINYSRFILPLRKCYRFEPVPPGLDPNAEKLIIGGGANIWGNYVKSEDDLDRYLFPRLLALSEVYWSPRSARDFDSFQNRMEIRRKSLEKRGVVFGDTGLETAGDALRTVGMLVKGGAQMVKDRIAH